MRTGTNPLLLVALLIAAGLTTSGHANDEILSPRDRDGVWESSVLRDIRRLEYHANDTDSGLQAPNRAQNLRTHFRRDGIDVRRRVGTGPTWRFHWQTLAFGRPGGMQGVEPCDPLARGSRVTYYRPGITEWYDNRAEGLEQGFTIDTRPAGTGSLVVTATLTPKDGAPRLRAAQEEATGAIEFFTEHGVRVLRYDSLHVLDARQHELSAHIELVDERVSIIVDDLGAEYPLTIDPLLTSTSWVFDSEENGSLFSASVATAGDVNGDGYSDIIIGAPDYDSGHPDQGKIYVHFGSPDGPSAVADWTAQGNVDGAYLGSAVSTAGDVNGDGYDDIVVGASRHTSGQTLEGWVLVWHGGASGLGPTGSLGNADFVEEGGTPFGEFGAGVSAAGDVNGDGFDDIIVGTRHHTQTLTREGRVSVYYGSASGVSSVGAWHVFGGHQEGALGSSVACAGDVNADGFDDVIAGAPGIEIAGGAVGFAYVWFGGASGLPASPTTSSADWSATDGVVATDYARSVAGLGDVNGDGYADVLVGAPLHDNLGVDQGMVFFYPGTPGGPTVLPTWQWSSLQDGALVGLCVATAGDTNGDGLADVIVGAPEGDSPSFSGVGAAYLFEGRASGLATFPTANLFGTVGLANFGDVVAAAGDVNGDGYGDVLVGEPLLDGRAFVYPGAPAGLSASHEFESGAIAAGSTTGWSVASAGDVNGDGYSDAIVGAPFFDNGQVDEGIVVVYLGSRLGLTTVGFWLAESNQTSAWFGSDVASAGDVNGDGYSDVIIGCMNFTWSQFFEGAAFLWFGSAAGLGPFGTSTNADWMVFGGEESANLGTAAASAGDVNGDGIGDIIVGVPGNDEVRVYHGRLGSAPSITADWTATGTVSGADFGHDVASGGDVNRDGYSDVIVGAPQHTNDVATEDGEGWVFVWHGSESGLGLSGSSATADWSAQSNQALASFGFSVAGAGDVNGDGYSDVIAGAHRYDRGQSDEGHAFVWYGSASGLGQPGTPTNADWQQGGNQDDAGYGFSVAYAGDVNNDGFGDVIVGAWGYTDVQPGEGRAFVYHGSTLGPDGSDDWFVQAGVQAAGLGWSVAGAGDVDGDGFGDVIVGAPGWNDGTTLGGLFRTYHGGGGGGLDRPVLQRRFDNTAPIHSLGISDSMTRMRFLALARTPAGRGRVHLEWELAPLALPLGTWLSGQSPADFDTGPPVAGEGSALYIGDIVGGISPGFLYHWRVRVVTDSPYFPHSPWFSLADQTRTELAFRAAGTAVGIADDDAASATTPVVLRAAPNPLTSSTVVSFELEQASHVELTVYDIGGRRIATLIDGIEASGVHSVMWDAQNASGAKVAPGVYFVRFRAGSTDAMQKIVLTR